ncbi:hypothetical protein FCV25MIE_33389 [Fagus crenata]
MFLDVIQAHEVEKLGTKEGTSSMVEEKGREYLGQVENEHAKQLEFAQVVGDEKIAVCETSQRVFGTKPPNESASNNLVKTNPTQVDSGQDHTVSPQLVISLGHVGPLEKQLIPEGLCLTQARFHAWAIVIHSKDHPKTTNSLVVIQDIEDFGIKPMEATSSESQTLGKKRILDGVHQEWSENQKIKLKPLKAIKSDNGANSNGKILKARRFKDLKKMTRDKRGRRKLENLINLIPMAEEASPNLPHPPS